MKKLILIIIVLFGSLVSLAQKDTSLLNKVYTDVKAGIQGISAGLKVGAEQTFEILVTQQKIIAITNIATLIGMVLIIFVFYKLCKFFYKYHKSKDPEKDLGDTFYGGWCIFTGLLVGVFIFMFVYCFVVDFQSTMTGFINPKYGAMKEIIEFVNNK